MNDGGWQLMVSQGCAGAAGKAYGDEATKHEGHVEVDATVKLIGCIWHCSSSRGCRRPFPAKL